jgi:bifunctional non-homologous end joining protein LigD
MGNELKIKASEKEVEVSNLDKVFWPEQGYTKADLLRYYATVSSYLLPHLAGRPMVMNRFPEGIKGHSFYQKECPEYAPAWLPTVALPAGGRRKVINYVLVQDLAGLLWLVNQGAIEMHPWQSLWSQPELPMAAILDLDPAPPAGFGEARQLALHLQPLMARYGLKAYPKTSGATGLHLYLPLGARYTYAQVRQGQACTAMLAIVARP